MGPPHTARFTLTSFQCSTHHPLGTDPLCHHVQGRAFNPALYVDVAGMSWSDPSGVRNKKGITFFFPVPQSKMSIESLLGGGVKRLQRFLFFFFLGL